MKRTFFVNYRVYSGDGEYEYYTIYHTLEPNEKANVETFNKILNNMGGCHKEVLSWSLCDDM